MDSFTITAVGNFAEESGPAAEEDMTDAHPTVLRAGT